jgi:hypothetical protein
VRLKNCSSCGREIPESTTICTQCEQWAADSVTGTVADARPDEVAAQPGPPPPAGVAAPSGPPSAVAAPLPSSSRSVGRGQLLMLVSAVAGAGLITLLLLSARGPSPAAAAARTGGPAGKVSGPSAPHESTFSQTWNSANRAHWVGNQRHAAAFELLAENTVSIWMGQARPMLVVRCASKSTEVFVSTGSSITMEPETEDHTVTFGFDREPDLTQRWPDSVEHDALFAPDGSAFARRLISARTMRFGYTPHNAAPVVASFHVSGLAGLIEPFAKDCGAPGK